MSFDLSERERDYLEEQLCYDHKLEALPPNTLVVHRMQHQLIVAAVQSYAAKHQVHMLDIGCGWGDFSQKLDPYLASYIGVEPSLIELERFQRDQRRCLVRGVGEYLDFLKDRSRNFILMNSVLDHGFNGQQMFAQALRILKPGGLLVLSMENAQKVPVKIRSWLGRETEHKGHLSFWGFDEMHDQLAGDFDILEARSIGFLFGFHRLTQIVPMPVPLLRCANKAANALWRILDPRGGHIMFFSAIRKGDRNLDDFVSAPFQCPACKASFMFGDGACAGCGTELSYAQAGILDAFALNPSLKSISETRQSCA
jgi:SAM-dependent methyltransferase